ncbi:hypothetical protein FRC08_003467 [Ceratobasidium sp. 394]|nr:hypothetical protein FRC08_003467 [Ceratobasidium sp. 394]KAG9098797.1 hypothetical protein FS749_002940 [Ceratobasidium sp. UAMH 11750]
MPPSTIMQGGVLPLEKIAALPGAIKQLKSVSGPPSEMSSFAQSLELDSPLFLSGILRSSNRIRYTIASSGSTTVITHPATSRNVAVIRWVTNATEGTIVETQDLTLKLNKWLETSDLGPIRARHFKKYGQTPSIKWTEKYGEWEATAPKKQVLAVLISRRSALGTRLEFTSAGVPHADALVLTALLSVTGEYDWRRYAFIRDNTAGSAETPAEDMDNQPSSGSAQQSDVPLPTYKQAPFTRPLAPLLRTSPGTGSEPGGGSATSSSNLLDTNATHALRPTILTLSTKELLSGVFSESAQKMVTTTTLGPYTTIILHTYGSDFVESAPAVSTNLGRATKVASIEWAPPSKQAPRVWIRGQYQRIADIVHKSSIFGSRKEKQFGHPNFLQPITWAEVSRTSTASIYNDPNTSIRYTCRSYPDNRPLAVLTRYLKRKGTRLELTPEGHAMIVEVVLTALLVVCGPNDWKEVAGAGVPTEVAGGGTAGSSLTVGEEMVSDLDGWAGPRELMRLRTEQGAEHEEV